MNYTMKTKEEILRTKITSYAPIEGREYSLNDVLRAMDEFANEILSEQKLLQHGVSGKRPDLHCQNACDWPNCTLPKCVVKSSAACANGAVDKTVSVDFSCGCKT